MVEPAEVSWIRHSFIDEASSNVSLVNQFGDELLKLLARIVGQIKENRLSHNLQLPFNTTKDRSKSCITLAGTLAKGGVYAHGPIDESGEDHNLSRIFRRPLYKSLLSLVGSCCLNHGSRSALFHGTLEEGGQGRVHPIFKLSKPLLHSKLGCDIDGTLQRNYLAILAHHGIEAGNKVL